MVRSLLAAASLTVALSCPTAPAAAQQGHIPDQLGLNVYEGYVAPALERFEGETALLSDDIDSLCASPSDEAFASVADRFRSAVRAFGGVSILRFGPVAADGRFESLFFWPDPRGVTLRQVQEVLIEEDASVTDPESLAGKSVALQGFPALDFVLFGAANEALRQTPDTHRCRYAATIAARINALAGQIADGFAPGTDFHASLTAPGPERDPYRSETEVANEVVKALNTAALFIRDAQIAPALGADPEAANGRRAPLWRGEATFPLMMGQIAGMNGLLDAASFDETLGPDARALTVDVIRFDLAQAERVLADIELAPEVAFEDEETRSSLRYVGVALGNVNRTVSEALSGAIGLVMGFNALDGD